jgi:elongation factor 1-alpha
MSDQKQHVSVVISGHVDSGKCQGRDTPILMHDGSIKMIQDIQVGDQLMGDDSGKRTVISTTKGQSPMFQISPVKGDPYTANGPHVLALKVSNYEMVWWDTNRDRWRIRWIQNFEIKEKSYSVKTYESKELAKEAAEKFLQNEVPKLQGYQAYGDVVHISVEDYLKLPGRVQDVFKGYSTGVEFSKKDTSIEPYAVGYWLGDGTTHGTEITTADSEVVKYFIDYADRLNLEFKKKGNSKYTYNMTTGTNNGGPGRNPFLNALKDYDLIGNKHIPTEFKCNSRIRRLQILAGLIDSDGSYSDGGYYEILTKLETLAQDICYLARSLGLAAYSKQVQKTCTNGSNGSVTGTYYRVTFYGDGIDQIPVLLNRKKAQTRVSPRNALVHGIKISKLSEDDYFGFELDGNSRYLMGDFTVTHNSTTTGHLIFQLGGMTPREREKLQQEADALGKGSFAFAFLMDKQAEERARGITITCATKEFHTESKHYTIIDAPGHRDFIKNMISGASQADVAVLLVPADGNFTTSLAKGNHKAGEVQGQTRQHALLLNLLGVKQLIVGINKMDCDMAKYSQERYEEVKREMVRVLTQVGWKKKFIEESVPIIPYSGFLGENLTKESDKMPWWKGVDLTNMGGEKVHVHTFVDAFEKLVCVPPRPNDKAMRTPISQVLKIKGVGDVLTGRVEQGRLKPGTEVVFLPTHTSSTPCQGKVFTVEMHHKQVEEALSGDNVGMNIKGLDKGNMPRPGDVMVAKTDKTVGCTKSFTIQVQVLDHPGELKVGYCPIGFVRTGRSAIRMTKINWKMGKETGMVKMENPPFIKKGEMAELEFEPQSPFVVDTFKNCEGLGRMAILEGNGVVMLGKVTNVVFKE